MAKRTSAFWQGFGIGAGIFVFFLLIALILGGIGLTISKPEEKPTAPPTTQPTGPYALQLPLKVLVRDAITGTAVSGGTLYILDLNDRILEAITVDTNGIATSNLVYKSGEKIKLFYVASGYGAPPVTVVVPYGETQYQQYHYLVVDVYNFPTESELYMSIFDAYGNQLVTETSNGTASLSSGKFEGYLHIVVEKARALVSYYDPVEQEYDDVLIVFILNHTLASLEVPGLTLNRIEYGGNVYYFAKLSDIIAGRDDPAIKDIKFTVYFSGTGTLSLKVLLVTHTDPSVFQSSLTADSDGITDSTAYLFLS